MAQLDLDAIRKQVPGAQGWSDAQLMQYYYVSYAQPRGMSWDTFSKSVGYDPKPEESSWKQDLVNVWSRISREAALNVTGYGPVGLAATVGKEALAGLDVAQAGMGKLLGQGASDITAEIGSLFGGPKDIQSAAQAIESSPEMQKFEAPISQEGADLEKGIGAIGTALAPHLPHVTEALEGEVEKHQLGPLAAAGAAVTVPALTALLTTVNPVSRALSRTVSEPLQAGIAAGSKAALEQTSWGRTLLASRAAEDRLWKHGGQSQAAVEESRQIATKWRELPLKPEDRMAIYDYQEDPSGSYPLTEAQKSGYRILYPYMDGMGWGQGYVHRETLVTSGGGPGRLITSMRKGTSPALAPRLSLAEGATEERQMFKLVPVQEVTDTGEAASGAKPSQPVESTGDSGYMTPAEAERTVISNKVKDIGNKQLSEAEAAEARVNARLAEWQRQDEEIAARLGGRSVSVEQAAREFGMNDMQWQKFKNEILGVAELEQLVLTRLNTLTGRSGNRITSWLTESESGRASIPTGSDWNYLNEILNSMDRKVKGMSYREAMNFDRKTGYVRQTIAEMFKIKNSGEATVRRSIASPAAPAAEAPVIAYIHRDDFQPAGQRTVVGIRNGNDFHVGNLEVSKDKPIVGQEITDPTGQKWRIQEATTDEIQGNSRVVYNRDLGVSVAEAWRQHKLRVATESLLDDLKNSPDYYGLIRKTTGEDLPGWEKFDNPWLQGYRAPARLRRTIDTLLGTRNLGFENVGGFINTAMLRANFIVNVWHMENMASFGLTEAAPRALTPGKMLDVHEDWGRAMDQVVTGGDDYLKLLRDGFPFMSRRTMGKEMYQHVINSLVKEVDGPYMRQLVADGRLDPTTLKYLGDGLKGMFQQGMGQAKYGFDMYESWPVWTMDDMLKMRAVYARMRRSGEDILTAGKKVAGDFPQYRLRYSTPGIGPLLDGLQRSGIVWFLPYHVDRLAVLGRRIGKAATLDPQAAGQLLASAALLTVVYPALDDAVRRATDTPGAHMERFGSERVLSQASKVASHQAAVGSLLSLMITPSAPVEMFTHQESHKGEAGKTLKEQALDFLAGQTGQSVYMMQDFQRDKTLQENLRNAFLSQIGVEGLAPPAGHGRYHPYTYQPPRIPNQ